MDIELNSKIPSHHIEEACQYSTGAIETLNTAGAKLHLSPRAYHRTLRLARTIADLEGSLGLETTHILEALQYRPKEN